MKEIAVPAPKAKTPKFKNTKPAKRLYPFWPAGEFPPAPPGRNDTCPCGSGTKFKRCHGAPVEVVAPAAEPATA